MWLRNTDMDQPLLGYTVGNALQSYRRTINTLKVKETGDLTKLVLNVF